MRCRTCAATKPESGKCPRCGGMVNFDDGSSARMDPDHPDVAAVLHLLDECDACAGLGSVSSCGSGCVGYDIECEACLGPNGGDLGTGKAIHPDRVIGSLSRWMLEMTATTEWFECGEMPDHTEAQALVWCRAAAKVDAEHGDA